MPDAPPTDPQLLSKVLRTKLGLSWEPRWDTPAPLPEQGTLDSNMLRPPEQVQAPLPAANETTMLRQRVQNQLRYGMTPAQRAAQGLGPEIM
jgi:hypothetical protein